MTFKDNWNKTDERCPNCNQVTKKLKGISKQNLKRLIIPKFDTTELLITFMLLMLILLSFVYQSETKQCREWIGPMFEGGNKETCLMVCDNRCSIFEQNTTRPATQQWTINTTKLLNENEVNETNKTH